MSITSAAIGLCVVVVFCALYGKATQGSDVASDAHVITGTVRKWHDDKDKVTCWYYDNLFCIQDSQLVSKQVADNGKAE